MSTKILVANRGEIAIRIIRAIQELKHEAVAIYETPDHESRHIRIANEAVWIGDGPRKDYLNIDKVIKAAKRSGAICHPSRATVFLPKTPCWPRPARRPALSLSAPLPRLSKNWATRSWPARSWPMPASPWYRAPRTCQPATPAWRRPTEFAEQYGYPMMLKATAGGGGRGIRRIENDKELQEQYPVARKEAKAAFNDDSVYLEKVVVNPKHVEVQIIADKYGKTVHLGTRDCSIQRRNQKLVEIAPAFHLSPELAEEICQTAVKAAKAANYTNAGTVEFLLDSDNNYYFMEINTRLQVEHTVTEMIAGIDIVRTQIKVALGKELLFDQEDIYPARPCH